jgi:cytochrome b561
MNTTLTPTPRYSPPAMLLHWLIAIAVIANWRIAESAEHASEQAAQQIMGNHMALGVVIFLLAIARLIVRYFKKPPPLASSLKGWEVALAKTVHTFFYVLLLGLPLLGWIAMSAYGVPISIFGWFNWPALPVGQSKETAETLFEIHHTLGGIMVLLIGVHILATLKHTLFDRDGNLFRMLPFGMPKP